MASLAHNGRRRVVGGSPLGAAAPARRPHGVRGALRDGRRGLYGARFGMTAAETGHQRGLSGAGHDLVVGAAGVHLARCLV